MEFKSYDEILSLHRDFTEKLLKRVDSIRDDLPKTGQGVIAVKRAALKQAQEAGAASERTRKEVLKRFDTEISRKRDEVTRLTQEIAEIEKSAKGGNLAKSEKTTKTTKPKKPAKPVK
jgi:hypothetical protein